MVAGDFNYPDINWDTVEPVKHSEHTSQKVIDAVRNSFLHQHVSQPTIYRHEQNPITRDLVLTSEENTINHINYLPGLGMSDHVSIFFKQNVYIAKPEHTEPNFHYNKNDYAKLKTSKNAFPLTSNQQWLHIPTLCPTKDKTRIIWMIRAAMAEQENSIWPGNAAQKLETFLTTSESHKRKIN